MNWRAERGWGKNGFTDEGEGAPDLRAMTSCGTLVQPAVVREIAKMRSLMSGGRKKPAASA